MRQIFIKVPDVNARQLQKLAAFMASDSNVTKSIMYEREGTCQCIVLRKATYENTRGTYTLVMGVLVDHEVWDGTQNQAGRLGTKPASVSRNIVSQLCDALEIFPEVMPARGPIG